jgi:plastocyanin
MHCHARAFFYFAFFCFGYYVVANAFKHIWYNVIIALTQIYIDFIDISSFVRNINKIICSLTSLMKKITILVVILVILGLGFYFYNKNTAKAPTMENNSPATTAPSSTPAPHPAVSAPNIPAPAPTPSPAPLPAATAGGGETPGSNIQVWEVDYNGTAFTPATVNINAGDWVFFKNKSTVNFWPKSSTVGVFDAGAAILPGKEFKFQFIKAGTFTYSDHLNPGAQGTVVVQ